MFITGSTDYILNGQVHGPIGDMIAGCRYDPGLLRPYLLQKNGRNIPYVTINTGRQVWSDQHRRYVPEERAVPVANLQARGINSPVFNATSLRKEEWVMLDTQVQRAARYRLRAWADLAAANSYSGFNGMSKLILEHETMTDPGEAMQDMDGLTEGRTDSPKFQLEGLPLPITHSDFWFSARRLAVSRNTGMPLDTTMGEAAGRRVAELIEKSLIGNISALYYGGNSTQVGGYGRAPKVYGYTTFPARLTKTNAYLPTGTGRSGSGWVPADTLKDVLASLDQLRLNKYNGPFTIYHSNDWDAYLDNDYILTGGNVATQTLRERLRAIDGITDVKRLDFMFASAPAASTGPGGDVTTTYPFTMIIVQMTPDVARAVNGMDITTVQWESVGGMRLNFKVMCIQVPQLRADAYGNCGILHMTASS